MDGVLDASAVAVAPDRSDNRDLLQIGSCVDPGSQIGYSRFAGTRTLVIGKKERGLWQG